MRLAAIAAAGFMTSAALAATAPAAYPPSCFADGLPLGQANADPHWQSLTLTLHGDFNSCQVAPGAATYSAAQAECQYSESVAVTLWRVPCSGGKSATLLELDRSAGNNGNTNLYPTFPAVSVKQGSQVGSIRLAQDANTTASQVFANSPVISNSVYTLENFATATPFDYNQPFTLSVDNAIGTAVQFDLLGYDPADYAQGNLPISGYLSGSWYLPGHGGEGMLTQILDNPDGVTRIFTATWYTFDSTGAPFWLIAQGSFVIGATHVDKVPVAYVTGGGFAGDFASVNAVSWGTMSFSFADCNTLNFSFASTVGSSSSASSIGVVGPSGDAPVGSGTRTWTRIGNMNHLGCQ